VLVQVGNHPLHFLLLWNWKSALLSMVLRGPIFLGVTIRRGWHSIFETLLVESIFCVGTAGFYGAIVQTFRNAEPEWLTGVFLALIMPMCFQVLEYGMHYLRGTPHLKVAEIISVIVSALSGLFNWYAMRQGTMLVAGEGVSLGADVKRLPFLLLEFFILKPYRFFRNLFSGK
jgi:hypothetical protein